MASKFILKHEDIAATRADSTKLIDDAIVSIGLKELLRLRSDCKPIPFDSAFNIFTLNEISKMETPNKVAASKKIPSLVIKVENDLSDGLKKLGIEDWTLNFEVEVHPGTDEMMEFASEVFHISLPPKVGHSIKGARRLVLAFLSLYGMLEEKDSRGNWRAPTKIKTMRLLKAISTKLADSGSPPEWNYLRTEADLVNEVLAGGIKEIEIEKFDPGIRRGYELYKDPKKSDLISIEPVPPALLQDIKHDEEVEKIMDAVLDSDYFKKRRDEFKKRESMRLPEHRRFIKEALLDFSESESIIQLREDDSVSRGISWIMIIFNGFPVMLQSKVDTFLSRTLSKFTRAISEHMNIIVDDRKWNICFSAKGFYWNSNIHFDDRPIEPKVSEMNFFAASFLALHGALEVKTKSCTRPPSKHETLSVLKKMNVMKFQRGMCYKWSLVKSDKEYWKWLGPETLDGLAKSKLDPISKLGLKRYRNRLREPVKR